MFEPANRTGFHHPDYLTDLRFVIFIMRMNFLRHTQFLAQQRMPDSALDEHRNSFITRHTAHATLAHFSMTS